MKKISLTPQNLLAFPADVIDFLLMLNHRLLLIRLQFCSWWDNICQVPVEPFQTVLQTLFFTFAFDLHSANAAPTLHRAFTFFIFHAKSFACVMFIRLQLFHTSLPTSYLKLGFNSKN